MRKITRYQKTVETSQSVTILPHSLDKKMTLINPYVQDSKDVKVREFVISGENKVRAIIIFIEGLVEPQALNNDVLEPLMLGRREEEANSLTLQDYIDRIQGTFITVGGIVRTNSLSDVINPALVQSLVFGEKIARQGLESPLDIILRSPKIKNAIPIGIVEGRAADLLDLNVEESAPNVGQYILQLLDNPTKRGFVVSCTIHQFNINSLTPGKNPVVPTIKAVNDNKINITGTAIFDRMKMIARIGKPETRTLILLRGIKSGGYIPYSLQRKGQLERGTVYLRNSRSVKVERQDDKYAFHITIKMKGYIVDKLGRASLLKDKDGIPKVEETVSAYLERDCQQFIEKMQNEFEVDCIDISKFAMAKWRNELEGKDDRDFIKNADIKVKVEVKLDNFGETT